MGVLAKNLVRLALPLIATRKTYQPVFLGGRAVAGTMNKADPIWSEIEKIMSRNEIKTVADLGCAEGYYVRKAVERGCFAVGVDADPKKLLWTNTLTLDDLENFGFIKMKLARENVPLLPASDLVIMLSLAHHIMYNNGYQYALEFMRLVRGITKKVMIFEMGQSNETHYPWAKLLPDMGADPHSWVAAFLGEAGFARVELLRKVRTEKSGIDRAVFAAFV